MPINAGLLSIFNTSSQQTSYQPVALDLSFLTPPVDTQSAALFRSQASFTTPNIRAPWQTDTSNTPISQKAQKALSLKSLIDLKAPEVQAAKGDADLKTTFALYRALDQLQALASYAADAKTPLTQLAKLNERFQKGVDEVQNYLASADTDKLSLLFGGKDTKLTTVETQKPRRTVDGKAVVTGSILNNIPNLPSSGTFTVKISKSTSTDTFTINLADLGGAQTLGAVASLINQKIASKVVLKPDGTPSLTADGKTIPVYLTRVETYKDEKGNYGLRFAGNSVETVTLDDPTVSSSVYVVSQNTKNALSTGTIHQLGDPSGALIDVAKTSVAGVDQEATDLAKKIYDANLAEKKLAEGAPKPKPPGDIAAPTYVQSTASDSEGFTYVVGTSTGNFGNQLGSGQDDLFLTKYAADGSVVFSRLIGGGGANKGFAVTVDSQDNVYVAGSTTGKLTSGDVFSGQDSFVTKFAKDGKELFTVQLDRTTIDEARAITTDAAGNIYVAGTTAGTISSTTTSSGKNDIYLVKIDGAPRTVEGLTTRVLETVQLGTTENDSVGGLAIGSAGALYVASTENGNGVVRKYNTSSLASPVAVTNIGNLGGGQLNGIAYDAATDQLGVVGSSTSGALAAGPVSGSHSGASDAILARFDGNLTSTGLTFVGSTGTDTASGIVANNGKFFITGTTTGVIAGTGKAGTTDGFISRIDGSSGVTETTRQFGTVETATAGAAIGINPRGTSATLATLGLAVGTINAKQTTDLISQTSLRAGDNFFVSLNGGSQQKITIREGDTWSRLVNRINTLNPGALKATLKETSSGSRIQLEALGDAVVELTAGDQGKDALSRLGLNPTKLLSVDALFGLDKSNDGSKEDENPLKPGGSFSIGLSESWSLSDRKSAEYVANQVKNSVESIKRAYRSLFFDPVKAQLAQSQRTAGQVPTYLTDQLGNYQAALARLGGGTSSGNSGGGFSL